MANKVDSPSNLMPMGEIKHRLKDTNPDGLYTGTGVRNAIQGDGFLPGGGEGDPRGVTSNHGRARSAIGRDFDSGE